MNDGAVAGGAALGGVCWMTGAAVAAGGRGGVEGVAGTSGAWRRNVLSSGGRVGGRGRRFLLHTYTRKTYNTYYTSY